MNFNRVQLKEQAKVIIAGSKPKVIYVGLVFLVLSFVISILSAQLTGYTVAEMVQYMEYVYSGESYSALAYLRSIQPPAINHIVGFALSIVYQIVSVGFVIFLINTIRNSGACFGNLLDGFGMFLRIICLFIIEGFFVFLWSLLLFIPGFIAMYSYRQSLYLLIDHPDWSPLRCIRESKAMMKNHKGELFVMDLSFLGWALLCGVPILGFLAEIWYFPYASMTYTLYYEWLRGASTQQSSGSRYEAPPWEG